ncbi:MAG: hypothetical protein RBQ87_04280 [Candidatus Cloacimonadaceae bacterium]|jgi:hypothetical protein|nr:hypothetical protein [Candidatus Cloacimonadaceae bacterium]
MFGIVSDIRTLAELGIQSVNKLRKKPQLIKLTELINDWFDYIDCNLEGEINQAVLNNKENKVLSYIGFHLKDYRIKPNRTLIKKWNKRMGYKKALLNSKELFMGSSRLPYEGVTMSDFFMGLIGGFSSFYSAYRSKYPSACNYSNIELPVKFLNFYVYNR